MPRKPLLVMLAFVALSACNKSEFVDDADAGDGAVEAGPDVDADVPDAVAMGDADDPDADADDGSVDGDAPDAAAPPHIAAPVVSHPFGVVAPGAAQTVTLRFVNDGGSPSGELALWLVGSDFEFVSESCHGVALAPGEGCDVTIRFESMTLGDHRATLHGEADPGGHEVIEILATVGQTL